jgi:hypothetical protein
MTRKLACLADCDYTLHGDDRDRLGRRMQKHLADVHDVPADPTELAALAIPVAGVRPDDPTSRADGGVDAPTVVSRGRRLRRPVDGDRSDRYY